MKNTFNSYIIPEYLIPESNKEKIKQKIRKCKTRKQAVRTLYYETNVNFIPANWLDFGNWIKNNLPRSFWKNKLLDMIDKHCKKYKGTKC